MINVKFRGKDKTGKWNYGDLAHGKTGKVFIRYWHGEGPLKLYRSIEVDPETVGFSAGTRDKHGKPVFTGDYVLPNYGDVLLIYHRPFGMPSADDIEGMPLEMVEYIEEDCTVIGNVFDDSYWELKKRLMF